MPIDIAQYGQRRPPDEDGFVAQIVKSVRSIPHLPNAIARGINEPGITEEERGLRARALSEAAGMVIPALFSGGASLILKGATNPLLKLVMADALGGAVGGGVAAGIEGGDVKSGAISGGLTAGILGGAGRGFVGSRAAAEEFAQKSAMETADLAKKASAREAEQMFQEATARQEATATNAAQKTAAVGDNRVRYNPSTGQAEQTSVPIPNPAMTDIRGQMDLFGGQTGRVGMQVEANNAIQPDLFDPTYPGLKASVQEVRPVLKAVPHVAGETPGANWPPSVPGEMPEVPQSILVSQGGASRRGPNGRFIAAKESASKDAGANYNPTMNGGSGASNGVPSPRPVSAARATALEQIVEAPKPLAVVEEAAGMPSGIHVPPAAAPPRVAVSGTAAFAPEQVVASGSVGGESALVSAMAKIKGKVPDGWTKVADEAGMVLHRALAPARTLLHRMGPTGQALAGQLDDIFLRWRRASAEDIFHVEQTLKAFGEKDRIHIGEIMEGLATPKSDAHLEAVTKLEGIYAKYAGELDQSEFRTMLSNGSYRDFIARKNYLTHYYDEKTIAKYLDPNSAEFARAAKVLKEQYGYTTPQARSFLRETLRLPSEFRTGPVNFARTEILSGGYEKDPLKVMTRYIYNVRKRLEVAKDFGADYKGFDEVAKGIQAEAGDTAARAATRIFNAFNDKLPTDHKALVDALSNFNALTMLGVNAGFAQPAQLANTAALVGYGNLIKAVGLAMRKEGPEWVRRIGSHVQETVQELAGTSKSGLMDFYMQKVIWLEPLDKVNRVVSSLAGKVYAEELGTKVGKRGLTPRIIEQLKELGLNPSEVLAQGGRLTDDQIAMAAIRVSDRTQFASSVLDLPEMKNSQAGRLIYQFRSFALQQTQFLMREVMAPAKTYLRSGGARGSLAPLARYATSIGAASYILPPLLRATRGRQAPDGETEKAIENVMLVGGLGVFGDTFQAMEGGKERILSLFVGPTGAELARAMGGTWQAGHGKPDAIAKQVIGKIPVIGPALVNYWLFPKE